MPQIFELNGQMIALEDNERRALLAQLIRQTRFNVWNKISSPFCHSFNRWTWHRNQQNNPIHWVIEAAGGADLPPPTTASRLKARHDKLDKSITAAKIQYFYQNLDAWQRQSAFFRRSMRNYLNAFDAGGGRAVRVLTVAREGAFITLGVCAALLTGGATASASAAALATTEGAAAALVRTAATNFVLNEIRNGSIRVGRQIAGETITTEDTLREMGDSALSSARDAMLGGILGRFIGPLKDQLTAAATREIRNGRLFNGMAIELTSSQIESAITDTINNLRPAEQRSALQGIPQARSTRECARTASRNLMTNRNFRRQLERNLEAEGS